MDEDFLSDQGTPGPDSYRGVAALPRRGRDAELAKKIIQGHTKFAYINSNDCETGSGWPDQSACVPVEKSL